MAQRAAGPWLPEADVRDQVAQRLLAVSDEMATTALGEISVQLPWFGDLDAEYRSWIGLVVRAGVDGFVDWFSDKPAAEGPANIFAVAPRALMRRVSLQQTVELIRATISSVEDQLRHVMPLADQPILDAAILRYSREVAFDAAVVYARAAESRGAWDARIEAQVMDAVIRGDVDDTVTSRATTLGWGSHDAVCVVIADLAETPGATEDLRHAATRAGLDLLATPQGDRLIIALGGPFTKDADAVAAVEPLTDHLGPGAVVLGPVVASLESAATSARAAIAGFRAAHAWPDAPRPVAANALLPERALSGDGHARRQLAKELFQPLADHSGGLLETLAVYFDEGYSIEATARRLFIHPNTVRYRLGKVADVTGYSPHTPRDAYALRLALTLGRLMSSS